MIVGVVLLLVLGLAISWRYTDSGASAATPVVGANDDLVPVPPDCSAGTVQLTFDDGPSPDFTPLILGTLRAWGARASFFVLGSKVQQYPDLVRQMIGEGHQVGNHSWSHPHLTTLTRQQVRDELARTSAAIEDATGDAPMTWRPPYEDWNDEVDAEAKRLGMSVVLWDYATDSNDW
ncbi:MAG TPA: polysaccharide deacetylase family protein, partial [Dermatophilaceae bacterium]|nr:polysaccharide deacetylase family protein [Dermatophilaceae bacterium]